MIFIQINIFSSSTWGGGISLAVFLFPVAPPLIYWCSVE